MTEHEADPAAIRLETLEFAAQIADLEAVDRTGDQSADYELAQVLMARRIAAAIREAASTLEALPSEGGFPKYWSDTANAMVNVKTTMLDFGDDAPALVIPTSAARVLHKQLADQLRRIDSAAND